MTNKKIVKIVLSLSLIAMMVVVAGCSNAGNDGDSGGSGAHFELSWDKQLDAETYAPGSASLVDSDGTVIAEMSGAMQLNATAAGSALSSDSYFSGADNSYRFVHDGSDWGGIFAKNDDGVDVSAASTLKVAVKGTIPSEVAYLELKVEDTTGTGAAVNMVEQSSTTAGDWTVYSVPFSSFVGIDMTKFAAVGLWHPFTNAEGNTAEGSYVAVDFLIDIVMQ